MNKGIWAFGAAAILAAAGAAVYMWSRDDGAERMPPRAEAPPAEAKKAGPQILHPIENVRPPDTLESPAPMPALAQSDELLKGILSGFVDRASLEFFYLDNIINRFVATIDNLPRKDAAVQVMPVKPVRGAFAVDDAGGGAAIASNNYARYAAYVRLIEALDAEKAVATYARYYPLFQQAYVNLGYPSGYFNDRLIQVIDHLLATPEVPGPVKLVRPKVMYKFADPELESLSAGQKAMVRMGSENAAKVKAKLRAIRSELTGERRKRQ